MGTTYDFTCQACNYTAHVSGGRDVGMIAVVHTMSCRDCRELVNVLTGRQGKDGPTGDPGYDKGLGRCPRCKGREVVAWTAPGPCPRCGEVMGRSDYGVVTMWD